jgi:fused signal recognition particle receptor
MAWGERNQVAVIAQESGDAAAVAHDAVKAGQSRQQDLVIIDTAGRLSTQTHLMDELKKVKRVIGKAQESAPHETILVIDGNTGQNGMAQVKAFHEALNLSGIIVTKLDGTARGGVLLALAAERPIPVVFLGVGEGLEDLQPFDPEAFAQALL